MSVDPAEKARERRKEIERLLTEAAAADGTVTLLRRGDVTPTEERLTLAMVMGIDKRVRAICLHLGLTLPDEQEDDHDAG